MECPSPPPEIDADEMMGTWYRITLLDDMSSLESCPPTVNDQAMSYPTPGAVKQMMIEESVTPPILVIPHESTYVTLQPGDTKREAARHPGVTLASTGPP